MLLKFKAGRTVTLLASLWIGAILLTAGTGNALGQSTNNPEPTSNQGGENQAPPGGGGGGAAILHNNPAEKFVVTPGGVDMRTARYMYNQQDLSIGGDDGLSLARITPMSVPQQPGYAFGNFSFNWDISFDLYRISIYTQQNDAGNPLPPGNDYQVYVNVGGRTHTFQAPNAGSYAPLSRGPFETLTWVGTQGTSSVIYKFSDDDHNVISFAQLGTVNGVAVAGFYPTDLTKPDGTKLTFGYTNYMAAGVQRARIRTITSSRGFALLLEFTNGLVTKACTLNLAQGPIPSNFLCPATATSTATYGYTDGKLSTVTGPDGKTSSFVYGVSGSYSTVGFVHPGASSPWLTNTIATTTDELGGTYEIVASQAFADGRSYTYTPKYTPPVTDRPSSIAGGFYIDNLGNRTTITFGFPIIPGTGPNGRCPQLPCSPAQLGTQHYQQTSGPVTIKDALGRTTTSDYCDPRVYCSVTLLQSFTDPEGIKVALTYDNFRNVTKSVRSAKPGSGLRDQETTATYDCSQPVFCAKPTSVTDPRGNTTNYTYDATHGGVLTETAPGDANGMQAVKRYAYVQRYAWISNGSGGYVQAATPIWLLASEKTCRATATVNGACAGGAADEIITTYEYGPDSGPNLLFLRGVAVTGELNGAITTLRTCFTYDALGRKISETKPNGTSMTAVCS